jgi:hypothetical protein
MLATTKQPIENREQVSRYKTTIENREQVSRSNFNQIVHFLSHKIQFTKDWQLWARKTQDEEKRKKAIQHNTEN